ncbi:uncharacterized protein LOC120358671 isoform X2 [Solenopsis invicta]|uniref:uncharacterized protein LOC120358671 isoform X2 n=1 Tax=Solenopsis invicta TaxID=13686 RepID=UPI00193D548D|nr:uncharacterized protein LOC120358671 isoform X2 [Solenopsis invicta]
MSVIEKVQKNDKFYIVLLKDGLVTVPKQWLTNDKKYTYWPSDINTAQRMNLIKSCAEVNLEWEKYEIECRYGTAEPPTSKITSVSSLNMDYIDTNKLDSNSEIEEDIDEYHKSNNSNHRKNTSNNSVVKNLACNKSQEATGKSLAYNRNKKATETEKKIQKIHD